MDNLAHRIASFDKKVIGTIKSEINHRVTIPKNEHIMETQTLFFEVLAQPKAKERMNLRKECSNTEIWNLILENIFNQQKNKKRNLTEILNNRYSAKDFDPNKKISAEDFEELKSLLRMSPSSVNIQPWHFIIATTDEGKKRMAKGVQGQLIFNEPKFLNASCVVLFCAKTHKDEAYKEHIAETEDKDGRFPNEDIKQMMNIGRNMFINIHEKQLDDLPHWLEKQAYLNMGQFLLGAATLGIDACAMEGIDINTLNAEFGLKEKGFTAIAAVAIGYRVETDFNIPAKTPKSRLPFEEILTVI